MEELMTSDQRAQIRYRTNFKAQLASPNGEGEALLSNLSLSGLQLECSHRVIAALMPQPKQSSSTAPINIDVRFQVPTSRQSRADIDLKCLLIYTRRQAQDSYIIGAQFSTFEHHCEEDLQDYINHFGERA